MDEAPFLLARSHTGAAAGASVRVRMGTTHNASVDAEAAHNAQSSFLRGGGVGTDVSGEDAVDGDVPDSNDNDGTLALDPDERAAMDQEVLDAMGEDSSTDNESDTDDGDGDNNAMSHTDDGIVTDASAARPRADAPPAFGRTQTARAVDDGLGMSREEILQLDDDDEEDDDEFESRRGFKRPRTSLSPPGGSKAAVRTATTSSSTSSSGSDDDDDRAFLDTDFARALSAKFD